MPYYRRKRRRAQIWSVFKPWVLGALGLAALAGLWWGLTQIGPRNVSPDDVVDERQLAVDETDELRREVERLRADLVTASGTQEINLLEEAVAKQREIVAAGRGEQSEIRRLNELETQLETARAIQLNEQIEQLMARADSTDANRDGMAVQAAWAEALRLQREVNRSGAAAGQKNFVREERFEKQLQELQTQPLAAEIDGAMAVAREALEAQNWADALAALTTARELQLRLNNEFSRSRFASLRRLDEIERELESLDAATVAIEVDELESAGDAALEAGEFETSVLAYEEARQTQLRINRDFSRSRFLSSPRVEQLEVKRQTASSAPRLAGVREEMETIDRLLLRREVGLAEEKIKVASEQLEDVFEQLPKSEVLDADMRLKLSFLAAQTGRLRQIQDTVYDQLRPLPGVSERRLLGSEFPQELYLQVMRVNPSRNAGRAFSVDSVNWLEAMECCERLSWILARPVRLPTVDEFRVAVGDASTQAIPATGGSASQAMATVDAGPAGFFDLLGNLDEWLQPTAEVEAGMAIVGGGSFRDDESVIRSVPIRLISRAERARHVGFRVMVEFND